MKFRVKKQQQQQQTEAPFARVQQASPSSSAEAGGSVNEIALESVSAEMENDVSSSYNEDERPNFTSPSRHQSIESKTPSSSPPAADSPPPPPPHTSSSASTFPRPQLRHSASAPSIVSLQGFLTYIAERGRRYAGRQRWRLVLKDGTCNVSSTHVTERKRKYLVDLFTTVLDMKWRFNALMFSMAFVVSWTLFAFVWWLIALGNGDLDDLGPKCGDDNHTCCVANVYNFWTALLFSIESQHTIGYGFRVVEPHCVSAAVVLMVQSCVGVFIQCFITGVVFSKLSRPKSRAQTIMFSRRAVICRREGRHCLLFRVGDMRKSHLIGTSIRAMVVRDRVTSEGESIPLCQSSLKVETEMGGPGDTFAFLVWPVTVTHVIDEESPLWEISAEQLITEHFEIIVILEGTAESNGKTMQIRTSYLPSEILWGHRLTPLLTYQTAKGTYDVDHKQFNGTVPIAMTERSAKAESELDEAAADGGQGQGQGQQRKPFYQNLEKDSSISLVRHQAIGQPIELSTPKRLYKRFRPTTGNFDAQRSPTFTIS